MFFHRVIMWACLGFVCLGQSYSQSKQRNENLPISLSSFLVYAYSYCYYFFPHISSLFHSKTLSFYLPFSFSLLHIFFLPLVLFISIFLSVNMKKMKGFAMAMEYSPYPMHEDQRTRFKHQSLMQDFQDLHKETEAMRKKLQMVKDRKLTLLAEVRFLKRRHEFLMQNRSLNTIVQPQDTVVRSKSNAKEKKSTGKEHGKLNVKGKKSIGKEHSLQRLATGFDLNQKGKTYSEKETTFMHPSLNQKQRKSINWKEDVIFGSSSPILDLNQRERLYSGKEATTQTMTPVFDLNQISTEEEELHAIDYSTRIDEFKKSSIRIASDDGHQNDIQISACRNTGNPPNRVGKRKISWQDQVALRV